MKIQHLAIVFVIIILPISMVLSYYTGSQIKAIKARQTYNSKLLTATYDAIKSFQLNTINNKYSSLSDSKIRDIEASISTFYDSLGAELGASAYSEEDLSSYIPAILYTMYDGYYIYGKYYNESAKTIDYDDLGNIKVDANGKIVYKIEPAYQYGLRPYVYYACRYKNGINDFVVNYTLDNNITVYGKMHVVFDKNGETGERYVTKSGSLINYDLVSHPQIKTYSYIDSTHNTHTIEYVDKIDYDEITIEPEILQEEILTMGDADSSYEIKRETCEYIVHNNRKVYIEKDEYGNILPGTGGVKCFWLSGNSNSKQYITDAETQAFVQTMIRGNHLYSNSACQYFYDAAVFSEWVDKNLNNVEQSWAVDIYGNSIMDKFSTNTGNKKIFDISDDNNPLLEGSVFNENRINVIRYSIETNLSTAIANFGDGSKYEYAMPKMSEQDWYKLTNNISVASFMQGMPIGYDIFNDYCVVTNDKNKELVTDDSIYIVKRNPSTGDIEAHYPGCIHSLSYDIIGAYRNIEFERQTMVREGEENHFFPHSDRKSYDCMVNVAQTYSTDEIKSGKLKVIVNGEETSTKDIKTSNLRKVYLTALAREKYDLYRTNDYFGTYSKETISYI